MHQVNDVTGDGRPDLGVTVSVSGGLNGLYLLTNSAGGFLAPVEIIGPVGVTATA